MGLGMEIESFLGPVKCALSQQVSAICGPKNSRFPGPDPLPLAQCMHQKSLCPGSYKSQVYRQFYVQEPTGDFNRVLRGLLGRFQGPSHTTPPVRLSNITALLRLSNAPTHYKTYQKSRGNRKVHKRSLFLYQKWQDKCPCLHVMLLEMLYILYSSCKILQNLKIFFKFFSYFLPKNDTLHVNHLHIHKQCFLKLFFS